jgi:hypothetical protein
MFFDIVKSIYNKTKLDVNEFIDTGICIGLNRWLAQDKNNLRILSNIVDYTFYIDPRHYFYLLFFNFKGVLPYFKKKDKSEIDAKVKENKLIEKAFMILKLSDREKDLYRPILEKEFDTNNDKWKKYLGV